MIGIDIGGTKILAAMIDPDGRILARAKQKTRAEETADAVIQRIVGTALEVMQATQIGPREILCIGAGAPGPLDTNRGLVLEAPNLGWKNVPLATILTERLGAPAYISNDVNAGTWGEYLLGAGREADACLGVFIGTGIGGGIVLNGSLYEGASGVAGEIGHMLIDPKGPTCGCGQKGCLEAYASRTAITRDIWAEIKAGGKSRILDAKEKGEQIRSKQLSRAFEEGDKLIIGVLEKAAKYLGIGIASAAHLINPDRIILGGGVVEALGEKYVSRVREAFVARAFKSVSAAAEIVEARLGDDAVVLGAAFLARRRSLPDEKPATVAP